MWKKLLFIAAAGAGLTMAIAVNADAQRVHANAGVNARAQMRGPAARPPGWSHGRKVGWHCRVGTRGCIPPGLR